jgi:EAL domain-containing protein (putative c-di-GMP-specific phosphodiesterase class I)
MTGNPIGNFLAVQPADASGGHLQIDAILHAVREHLGMEIAFASRYVDDRREFTHINAGIPLPVGPGDGDPVDQAYCWHILNGRLPELIRDAAAIPFAAALPITAALPVGAHISVPLRLRDGSVYGSFCCLSRNADLSLTDRDLATVRAFAALAGQQIEVEREAGAMARARTERIRDAIDSGQPTIHLQPIHRLDDGTPVGAEALARFRGTVRRPPNLWFDEASEAGLGVDLELAAIAQAIAVLPYVPAGQYLSINASPSCALSPRLDPLLEAIGDRDVVLEITEHSRVEDYAALKARLRALRGRVRIAIDDVGAGYAGLRHIIALEPDILKLDISLTRDVHRDPAKRALAVALVSFAAQIGARIVAEGIECSEERRVLRELGIINGQGWLFSRAMPVVSAQRVLLGMEAGSPPAMPSPRRCKAAA